MLKSTRRQGCGLIHAHASPVEIGAKIGFVRARGVHLADKRWQHDIFPLEEHLFFWERGGGGGYIEVVSIEEETEEQCFIGGTLLFKGYY